jgi:hypothetical protein
MGRMDSAQTTFLRDLLAGTPWFGDCRSFARTVRTAPRTEGGLLLVGTPEEEPWHLAAHLDVEADLSGLRILSPTLVRHVVPDAAPPHLSVGLSRLTEARNGEAVLVVAPDAPGERLLDRVDDARRRGAAILALADDDTAKSNELLALAHDALLVPENGPLPGFDAAQHLLALAAGEQALPQRRGFRDRYSSLVDRLTGAPVREF